MSLASCQLRKPELSLPLSPLPTGSNRIYMGTLYLGVEKSDPQSNQNRETLTVILLLAGFWICEWPVPSQYAK